MPRNWVRTGFDMRLISFMAAQADQIGRPRYTRAQIAASLIHPVPYQVVSQYLPARGPGGDPRELPLSAIARIRALRAEKDRDGQPAYTFRQLGDMYDVHPVTIERHCLDLSFPDTAGNGGMAPTGASAEGGVLSPAIARRAAAMYAERDGSGNRLHTPDQLATQFGVPVSDLKKALRARRGVRGPGGAVQLSSAAVAADPRPACGLIRIRTGELPVT